MNKKRKGFMVAAILLSLLMVFFGCEADSSGISDNTLEDSLDIFENLPDTYSAEIFLGEWKREGNFPWLFQSNGTISAELGISAESCCCGGGLKGEYSYFFKGDYLVTYGPEMNEVGKMPDLIVANTFTVSDDGESFVCDNGQNFNGLTFTRENKHSFKRSKTPDPSSSVLTVSNPLVGTWKGDDGKEYVFGSDSGLSINSRKYGYLVWKDKEVVTLGPFVKGAEPVLQKYNFTKVGNKVYLRYTTDGEKFTTITLSAK